MKLSTKLTLFITGSKMAIVLLFILALPFLVREIASDYTNRTLRQQQKKVLKIVEKNGLDHYLQGDENYGSYTLLKEEFIAFLPVDTDLKIDAIKDSRRLIEGDTLNYRVLSYTFKSKNKNYLLEIGKTTASIDQYNKPLQRFALYVLITLIVMTILIDLTFIRVLIKPLSAIIKTKLVNSAFPFESQQQRIKTSTTDFKYLDESLILLMKQINEAFYKEREFTSNASHELMTPISILQNKMENFLADENIDEASAIAVVEMMKTVDRLKKITSSLLLISRIENQQYASKEPVQLLPLFEDLIEEIKHRLEEKSIHISLDIAPDVILPDVNKDLIFQLFFNLIHNAIKFNRQDGRISIAGHKLKNGNYMITISDTGIGIPKEDLPFVFDRFRKTNLHSQVGYGLGLAIVKSIAAYLKIDITADSVINEGTTFTLIFRRNTAKL
ncbi:signal transduction histidine kinase [Arcticibacter tournemirensis]|uniref:histidine kinase n=1 Tax=Arcticibacter tournemirensis TaxID=699437 RepID=A0A5M9GPX8_9SPHI|nr:HAMP domain-containing sensor histidine kinase [Arcticibacter tournemirensis]KAA8476802.1 HAMP domain-containing histidine kinase [Arcticibacter tournemirensis]TQM50821.1 signal transduction histidine kinase [Arcticibacter tournemirensis]